jgi:type I site-specific restriction-modification system R (restriction) subunit
VLTNRKPEHRRGQVQLIDATQWFRPLRKNMGKKNCELAPEDIQRICDTFLAFKETPQSKIFPNAAFGYWKVKVERPLRLHSQLTRPRIETLRFASGDEDSYRAEKKATLAIALPDADAEIEPVPTSGGGRKPQPEMDKLSNIIKAFNDQFGGLFNDPKAVEKRIIEVIPPKVSADPAYKNARQNSDRQNAQIEHDKALKRVITAMFKDDAQPFKQFQDNDSFRRWLTDTIFGMTYKE